MRPTLAISLFVSGQRALVIGDGPSAADRATRLTGAGATITAIPESAFTPAALAEHRLVFVCDEAQDPDLAARVHAAAQTHTPALLCYAQDRPDHSDFAMPALVRRGHVRIAISTEGAAPALARRLREELDRLLDPRLAAFAASLAAERAALPPGERRARLAARVAALRIEGLLHLPE